MKVNFKETTCRWSRKEQVKTSIKTNVKEDA